MTNTACPISKMLEYLTLEYLNRVQPFRYYNTLTGEIMPISPYRPSLYKYSKFDFYNDYILLDLKTLSTTLYDPSQQYVYANCIKLQMDNMIFIYSFENNTQQLVDLHFVNYTVDRFDTFHITSLNNSEVHNIPKWINVATHTPYEYFIRLDTTYVNSHQININYTDDYKHKLEVLVSKDYIAYQRSWGMLSIIT